MEQLTNNKLSVTVSSRGAELQSIKDKQGHEYLWQANPAYWGKRSPLLFPIVCGLWRDSYRIGEQTYEMKRHGFASKSEFTLLSHTENSVTYSLQFSDDTLKVYPYKFCVNVNYVLEGNTIQVLWHVQNLDTQDIYFQIGGHPAFNIPDMQEGDPLHGFLRFDNPCPKRLYGNTEGCITPGHHAINIKDNVWEFTGKDFDDDALIFDEKQISAVDLLDNAQAPVVSILFNAPAVGIWSPTGKNAPFICLEPWYGIHDWHQFAGEFKDKYLMNKLLPGASFVSRYDIVIHKA